MTQPATTIHPFTPPHDADVLALWQSWQRAGALSDRTIGERAQVLRSICDMYQVSALDLGPSHIVGFLARPGIADTSRATYATSLRAFFRWAITQNLITANPMDRVPTPKRPRYMPRPIQTAQLSRLLTACNRQRTRMMVLLCALAGLRVHEVAKFRGSDLDAERGTIAVVGKGSKPAMIPAHPAILELAATFPRDGYWFPSYSAPGPIRPQAVSKAIAGAMHRAGIDGTAHQLRHWYGTELLHNGADLRTVQELMRHDSIVSTQIYTQVTSAAKTAALGRLALPEPADPQ